VLGRGGHAAHPGQAVNAIDKAIIVKQAVDRFAEDRQNSERPLQVNLGVFHAGTLPAVVPAAARLEYNIAYDNEEAAAAKQADRPWGGGLVMARFERCIAQAGAADPWLGEHAPEVSWIKDIYPFLTSGDERIVRCAKRAYERVFGEPRPSKPMDAWFDAAHIAIYGQMPVVGMGAGLEDAAHSQQERIGIGDMVANAKAVALAAYDFLSG
jgi:acetylornithine deacetylase